MLAGCSTLPPVPAKPDLAVPARFQGAPDLPASEEDAESAQAWWLAFGDDRLNALVDLALQNNQDFAKAKARIDKARAQAGQDRAALSPMLTFSTQVSRAKASQNIDTGLSVQSTTNAATSFEVTQNAYLSRFRLPLDASYEVDLWGRLGDSARASAHLEAASVEDFNAARLSLATSVVTSYLLLLTHQAQLAVLQKTEMLRAEISKAMDDKAASGLAEQSVVDSARTAESDVREQAARMKASIGLDLHGLDVLCGAMPGMLPDFGPPASPRELQLPPLPVDVPSSVLKRRPDVRRAEAQLDAALARVSAARADFFPTLKLTTGLGVESSALSTLLQPGSTIWSLAAQITYPILDGGRRRAQLSLAAAEVDEASRNYQSTVIQALREVEDSLTTINALWTQWTAEKVATRAAFRTADRARERYRVGLGSKITYLDALQIAMQRQLSLLDIEGQGFIAYATLRKVLGRI